MIVQSAPAHGSPEPRPALNTRYVQRPDRPGHGAIASRRRSWRRRRECSRCSPGGADSVCLVHALAQALGPDRVEALHVQPRAAGRRPRRTSGSAASCARASACGCTSSACRSIGAATWRPRRARRATRPPRPCAGARGSTWSRPGTPATDQVETVLYRLVSSPGRRALLGMAPLRDRIVRPLLDLDSEDTRAYCRAAGLDWREDESNQDRALARNRLRLDVLPALREIHPAAEQNVMATAAQLQRRAGDRGAGRRRGARAPGRGRLPAGRGGGAAGRASRPRCGGWCSSAWRSARRAGRCRWEPTGCARSSASQPAAGAGWPSWAPACARSPSTASCGSRATPRPPPPAAAELPVPGTCRFGAWELECLPGPQPPAPATGLARRAGARRGAARRDAHCARLAGGRPHAAARPRRVEVPAGLFSDRKVPRSLRRSLPVVVSGDEIAWVAGVAVSDLFKQDRADLGHDAPAGACGCLLRLSSSRLAAWDSRPQRRWDRWSSRRISSSSASRSSGPRSRATTRAGTSS